MPFATAAMLILLSVSCQKRVARGPLKEVRLGYFANLTHAQAVLGVSSGEFAQAIAPAQLRTQVFNAGPSLIEALLAGEIDIAYVGPGPALNAQAKTNGLGIRVIAGAASNGVIIVARPGSGIHTMADLKGRRLATPQHGNTQDLAARHYLSAVLHQENEDNILPISNAEQSGMMSRGQIDASWAPEPWGSFLVAQAGAQVIAEEKDLWPDKQFSLTVVITTPDFLADHPDVVQKMLEVHRNWTRRLKQDPQKYLPQLDAALFSLTGKRLPKGVLQSAIARVQFTDEPSQQTFATLANWSYELEFTIQPPNLAGLFDTAILHKLEKGAPAFLPLPPGEGRGEGEVAKDFHLGKRANSTKPSPRPSPGGRGGRRALVVEDRQHGRDARATGRTDRDRQKEIVRASSGSGH
ncbi:MAG TPA: ABC transporter substrate-binding protein [Tepidisphaeraceae bacterium]|nr:ABC transporter substrate-binding protein [Tepidisphaeraceae bacterium]